MCVSNSDLRVLVEIMLARDVYVINHCTIRLLYLHEILASIISINTRKSGLSLQRCCLGDRGCFVESFSHVTERRDTRRLVLYPLRLRYCVLFAISIYKQNLWDNPEPTELWGYVLFFSKWLEVLTAPHTTMKKKRGGHSTFFLLGLVKEDSKNYVLECVFVPRLPSSCRKLCVLLGVLMVTSSAAVVIREPVGSYIDFSVTLT